MRELSDRYVFRTLLDGEASFHKKSYRVHAKRHPIGGPADIEEMQKTLADPDFVTSHDRTISGRQFRHHTYYKAEVVHVSHARTAYPKYWKVVIRHVSGKWWCVVTAFWSSRAHPVLKSGKESVIYFKSHKEHGTKN